MKISIITPTYNSAETLGRTIESVLAQDYQDVEYIIIDGGSSDGTIDVVKSFQSRMVIKFISEKDSGIYDAMNKGIAVSTGDIVGILNSDDIYKDGKVLSVINQAFLEGNIEVVYGDIEYFKDDINKITRRWRTGEYDERQMNNGWTIPHPSLFLRKEIYNKMGAYNTDFKIAGDYEFILRMLKKYKPVIKYIPAILVKMYQGGTSARNFKQRKKGWQELRRAWEVNGLEVPSFFIWRRILSKISQYI